MRGDALVERETSALGSSSCHRHRRRRRKGCAERGITVSNIRNYAVNTVPEHTFALILALRRSITAYRNAVVKRAMAGGRGSSATSTTRSATLQARRSVSSATACWARPWPTLGRAFGMNVLFSDYKGTTGMGPLYTPFDEVLRSSDVITLHSPAHAVDTNMIAGREFALMERRPLLINTARGGLVDEEALLPALDAGQIEGAGFDVVTQEPPPPDHPLMRIASAAERHSHAAHRLGERRGGPESCRSTHRHCRSLLGRRAAQRHNVVGNRIPATAGGRRMGSVQITKPGSTLGSWGEPDR